MTTRSTQHTTLDVRPILAGGGEPFEQIMTAAAGVPERGTLEILAPFEPVPLYRVLSERGFAHVTELQSDGDYAVRFIRTGITHASTVADVHARFPAVGPVLAGHGFDLCCAGGKTLELVAQAHGADLARLLSELQQAAVSAR